MLECAHGAKPQAAQSDTAASDVNLNVAAITARLA